MTMTNTHMHDELTKKSMQYYVTIIIASYFKKYIMVVNTLQNV